MLSFVCAALVVLLGAAGLSRWIFGVPDYLFGASWTTTTAPNTALVLLALGAGLIILSLAERRAAVSPGDELEGAPDLTDLARKLLSLAGLAIVFLGAGRLVETALDVDLYFNSFFTRLPRLTAGPASTGFMSIPTASCVVLSGAALTLLARCRGRSLTAFAAILGAITTGIGIIFDLGYLYGRPLSFGGQPAGISANTATAFIAGGVSIVAIVAARESRSRAAIVARLRSSRDELERRVAERTKELTRALESLQRETEERRKAEAGLIHAQRMDAIGRMSTGLAHDFNNLLTVITSCADLALARLQSETSLARLLRQAKEAAARAAALTTRLLTFARRNPPQDPALVEPGMMLEELAGLIRPLLGPRIRLSTTAAGDLWPVRADKIQLEQVLLNLCVNAKDAMPSGGRLELRAQNASIAASMDARPEPVPAGEYVRVDVTDSGPGLAPEVFERLFEPFVTTKPAGLGTGLGLATSYGIVRRHGGHITCRSTTGEGTAFSVFVPRAT